jgi:Pretoxin HINT domain
MRTQPHPVTALHDNHDSDLTDVSVQTADHSTATLHTTQHHPFYNQTRHTWTDASHLQTGDQLRTPTGQTAGVTTVRNYTATHDMRNLTINNTHTYYVIAGTTPVLVHNCGERVRFVVNNTGDVLDMTRVTIPEASSDISCRTQAKSGVFTDSMSFDQASLNIALRSHLAENFGNAMPSVPMTGGGPNGSPLHRVGNGE